MKTAKVRIYPDGYYEFEVDYNSQEELEEKMESLQWELENKLEDGLEVDGEDAEWVGCVLYSDIDEDED